MKLPDSIGPTPAIASRQAPASARGSIANAGGESEASVAGPKSSPARRSREKIAPDFSNEIGIEPKPPAMHSRWPLPTYITLAMGGLGFWGMFPLAACLGLLKAGCGAEHATTHSLKDGTVCSFWKL